MAREFSMPKHILTGTNALLEAGTYVKTMGTKAMIVSDEMMVKLHNVDKVVDMLHQQGIQSVVYAKINGEPTDCMIEEGVTLYQTEGCDFLVAIGGGSPIDSMKAIGAIVTNGGAINDYMGCVIQTPTPPMVAIPTTAGTGSEATQFTIITNTKDQIKMLLKGAVLIPELALIDPQFTLSAPDFITASTGLDALCHAVESYTSKQAQTLSKTFSISAIKKIMTYLPQAYDDGSNIQAREQMAIASLEAGIAFNNASVTIIHGMSRPIGALYHVPHGLSNAMLLKVCLSFVIEKAFDIFGQLAKDCGYAKENDDNKCAAQILLNKIIALVEHCHIQTPAQFGIDQQAFLNAIPKMAMDAMASGSPQNTMRTCTQTDIEMLYAKLW